MAKVDTSKKSFPVILIVFLLIILPVIGFYAGTKYRSYQLKTYSDRFYDYTFKYPADWFIDRNESSGGELKIGNDKQFLISVRVHPRGDKEYIEKIWKERNCVTCDYDLAPIPYTEVKNVALGKNNFYWNKDGSGAAHAFIVTPLKDKTIEFSTFSPNEENDLLKVLQNFEFAR